MKTSMLNAALLCLVAALATQAPTFLRAEEGKADAPSALNRSEPATEAPGGVKPAKEKGLPFRGTLGAINRSDPSITVKGKEKDRVFRITSQTRITKDGRAATLEDGIVGEQVAGYARETAGGTLEAVSLRFGAKPAEAETGRKSKQEPK